MSTTNIAVESTVKGTNNAGSTLTGDQVIAGVLEILQTDGFGLFQMFARGEQNGSVFSYKTPERMIPEAYARTGEGALGKGAKVPQVDITANQNDVVYLEFEDMEFATQELANAEKSRVAGSIVQSMMAQLDAEILETIRAGAESASNTSVIDFTKSGASASDLATSRMSLGDVIAGNESLIDAKTLGVPSIRQIVLLSPVAYWRYINSFGTNVVSQSDEMKIGNLSMKLINGSAIIKHPLIGKNLSAGMLHETKSYDLSLDKSGGKALEGFVLTDISVAMPFILKKQRPRVNKFGNEGNSKSEEMYKNLGKRENRILVAV